MLWLGGLDEMKKLLWLLFIPFTLLGSVSICESSFAETIVDVSDINTNESINSTAKELGVHSLVITDLSGKGLYSYNSGRDLNSVGSLIKLVLADLVSNKINNGEMGLDNVVKIQDWMVADDGDDEPVVLDDLVTIEGLIIYMLRDSSDTAANAIMGLVVKSYFDEFDGILKSNGYNKTTILYPLSTESTIALLEESREQGIVFQGNNSSASDISLSMVRIINNDSEVGEVIRRSLGDTGNEFKIPGLVYGKSGANKSVLAYSGLLRLPNGQKILVTVTFDVNGIERGGNDDYINDRLITDIFDRIYELYK